MKNQSSRAIRGAAVGLTLLALASPASAQSAENFYKGKSVTVAIGTDGLRDHLLRR